MALLYTSEAYWRNGIMRILLVYLGRLDQDGHKIKYRKAFLPPLSLAILDSLTPDEHTVDVVNDIVEPIQYDTKYDFVGITAMTTQIGPVVLIR